MAKRKGKSERRHSGWERLPTDQQHDELRSGWEKFGTKSVKIPAERLAAPQENLDELPKVDGLVVGLFPGGALVKTMPAAGAVADPSTPPGPLPHVTAILQCAITKTFRAPEGSSPLAVGDEVSVALTDPSHHSGKELQADKQRTDGFILGRSPRRSALSRPMPTSGKHQDAYEVEAFEKVIVANMDTLLIVVASRQPPLRRGLVDRFLIIAERGELKPVLAINKIDLGEPDSRIVSDFAATGMEIIPCSAATGVGLDRLRTVLAGRRSVLAGPSGVGKSTLVNALIPGAAAVTQAIRVKDSRGRHTTSAASIYELPSGLLVDTPGIREMGIRVGAADLPWYFPEFDAFSPACKFRDCTHTHEPSCAVRAAVESGEILERRYESYLRILDTLEQV